MGAAQSALEPCVRCFKFRPSAQDLASSQPGYQPVNTQALSSTETTHKYAGTTTTANTLSSSYVNSSMSSAMEEGSSNEWEEWEEDDDKHQSLSTHNEREEKERDKQINTTVTHTNIIPNTYTSQQRNKQTLVTLSPPPTASPPANTGGASTNAATTTSITNQPIDFFSNLGIASSGYQEPIRVQPKRPSLSSSVSTQSSPTVSAQVRADLASKYGLSEIAIDSNALNGWNDGDADLKDIDLGGNGSRDKKKKKGLGGVVALVDE